MIIIIYKRVRNTLVLSSSHFQTTAPLEETVVVSNESMDNHLICHVCWTLSICPSPFVYSRSGNHDGGRQPPKTGMFALVLVICPTRLSAIGAEAQVGLMDLRKNEQIF